VAIITTAGFAIGRTRMTQRTVIEFRGAGERVNGQKVIDVLVILVRAVRREYRG
jgi:pantothenate kinase